jgi:hypothetical protein
MTAPLREAAQAALDALEGVADWVNTRTKEHPWNQWQRVEPAIDQLRAALAQPDEVAQAVAAEQARCLQIIETYRIPCGNSAAGELAAEWTYDALLQIRNDIKGATTS